MTTEFMTAVLRMRHFQKEYFKTRGADALKNAKFWEKHVDHGLKEYHAKQQKLGL
jgi:hypothetical protein